MAHEGPRVARIEASSGLKRAIFLRDHYTCRYCGIRTVDLGILKKLSKLFPAQVPYHSNWKDAERHIILWSVSASLEHHLALAHGGTNEPENLVTACYQCNDTKSDLSADVLGWSLQPVPSEGWDGLTAHLYELSLLAPAVDRPSRTLPVATTTTRSPEVVRVGNVVLAIAAGNMQARRYKVEVIDRGSIIGREFWYAEASGECVYSKGTRVLQEIVAVLDGTAPTAGLTRAHQPASTHLG